MLQQKGKGMNKEIGKRWIRALRSGKYKQVKGHLKDPAGYCCLGVLCQISRQGKWANGSGAVPYQAGSSSSSGELPLLVKEWAGMKSAAGKIPGQDDLTQLNDKRGLSFAQIADHIEANLDAL